MTGFTSDVSEADLYDPNSHQTTTSMIYDKVSKLIFKGTTEVVRCRLYV